MTDNTCTCADCATEDETLARAIDYLGAVEVRKQHEEADGFGRLSKTHLALYAFAAYGSYWVATGRQLAERCFPMAHHVLQSDFIEMPSWWTPAKQFAAVYPDGYHEAQRSAFRPQNGNKVRCVTVNLETGEEVPA